MKITIDFFFLSRKKFKEGIVLLKELEKNPDQIEQWQKFFNKAPCKTIKKLFQKVFIADYQKDAFYWNFLLLDYPYSNTIFYRDLKIFMLFYQKKILLSYWDKPILSATSHRWQMSNKIVSQSLLGTPEAVLKQWLEFFVYPEDLLWQKKYTELFVNFFNELLINKAWSFNEAYAFSNHITDENLKNIFKSCYEPKFLNFQEINSLKRKEML